MSSTSKSEVLLSKKIAVGVSAASVRHPQRTRKRRSGGQLDKVFVPDPPDQISAVILVLGKPELAFFADDIEHLTE